MTAYGNVMTAGYGVDGSRIWKKVGSNAKRYFLYAGGVPVCEMSVDGTIVAINSFGPSGLISRHEGENHYFYTFDPLGHVCQIQNASGTVTTSAGYTAYGTPLAASEANPTPFGYGGQAGYYTDSETGLILCSARYYDPSQGRWLTRDPIGYDGGLNVYAYCGGNPIGRLDPSGLDWVDVTAEYAAGMGDTISCNGTAVIRKQWARDVFHQEGDLVDHCSSEYAAGETTGRVYNVVSVVVGGVQAGVGIIRGAKAIKAAGGIVKLVKAAKAARAGKPLVALAEEIGELELHTHHIVEQRNVGRFGKELIHNEDNLAVLEKSFHQKISAFYSSKHEFLTGEGYSTVREYMNTLNFQEQSDLGKTIMQKLASGEW